MFSEFTIAPMFVSVVVAFVVKIASLVRSISVHLRLPASVRRMAIPIFSLSVSRLFTRFVMMIGVPQISTSS